MKNSAFFQIAFVLAVLITSVQPSEAQKRCETCSRRAILDEFTNPNNPDYEQKREEWRQCMQKQLGDYVSFDADDPKVNDAAANCEQFEPTDQTYCFPSLVSTFLGEQLTNPCFHMLSLQYFNPDMNRNPEYLFRGSYEGNLEGGEVVEIVTGVFKPIIARMTIQLYYNGTSPELVQEWYAENTLNSPKGLLHKLNMPDNISPMLEEFEKRPAACEAEFPAQEDLCENGTGDITLKDFKDARGNTSREFNRIVVSIYKGEILNGEKCMLGPDYRVFTLEEGQVIIKYKPPADKDDGYDRLRVYNSCDILPPEKISLSETSMDELILDEHFPVYCGFYKGTITVTKSWDYTEHNNDDTEKNNGTQIVLFSGIFRPNPQIETLEDQPLKMYVRDQFNGTWEQHEQRYCEGPGCGKCTGLVYEEWGSGSIPEKTLDGLVLITNVWPTDNKAVADQLAQFGMENWYDIATPTETVPTQTRSKYDAGDAGCQWDNSTSTTVLTGSEIRYKLKDIKNLSGRVSWSSESGTTGISVTNMTEAIYGQKPLNPEKNGTNYTYTITWNLKAF